MLAVALPAGRPRRDRAEIGSLKQAARRPGTSLLVGTVMLACIAAGACLRPAFRTTPGPESSGLIDDLRAYVPVETRSGIRMVELPSLAETEPRPRREAFAAVHAIGGPDRRGRIGFVENYGIAKFHLVKTIHLDGSDEREVAARDGDAGWPHMGHAVGRSVALSPDTGLLAAVVDLRGVQMRDPDTHLLEGTLTVWKMETSTVLPVVAKALDAHLSFFPDGRRIAFTGLIDPGEAAQLLREHGATPEAFAKGLTTWPRLRAACILDLETGAVEAIHPGDSVLVSPDGTKMLVQGEDAAVRLVDLAGRRSRPAALPGLVDWWYHDALIAFVDEDRVLYRARPTEGIRPKWTTSNSPLVGPKPMLSVKVARLSTGEFQTVVPYLDPRDAVSFGALGGRP